MGNGAAALAGGVETPGATGSGDGPGLIYIPVEPGVDSSLRPRVTLVTEGTYPFYWGGVSTWCHSLVHGLPEVDFTILSIISDPNRTALFETPPGIPVVTLPMWGTRGAYELTRGVQANGRRPPPPPAIDEAIDDDILPAYRSFVGATLDAEPDLDALGSSIEDLHVAFLRWGFDPVMRHPAVWEAFRSFAVERFPGAAARAGYPDAPLAMSDVARGFQVVTRWLQPLGLRFPATDVVHAAMAGVCSLVAIAIKREQGAAFFLTEHGIYLREALLAESRSERSLFLKLLTLGFALQITRLSYLAADQISPCCDDHKRWEYRLGAPRDRVRTLYYGVDPSAFVPTPRPSDRPPTVVWVGRIDPLKDVETLLASAARVRQTRPDIRFRLFGSAPPGNEDYHERCRALHQDLGLQDTVSFEGFTSTPAEAFGRGDVAVLTSISEGFPYSTLEAMLCGRPIVATHVGGLPEQVADCGVIVEPRNPDEMARALIGIFDDAETLDRLGREARARSERLFSLDRFLSLHRQAYRDLTILDRPPAVIPAGARTEEVDPEDLDHSASIPREGLTEAVSSRMPMPVSPLEVTAVLESTGVTESAARRYGAPDTFSLAGELLGDLQARANPRPAPYDPREHEIHSRPPRSVAAVLGALVPAAAAAIVLTRVSGYGAGVRAAFLGMLVGLVLSQAMLQALTPRTSLYVGCQNWAGLRRILRVFSAAATSTIAIGGAGIVALVAWIGPAGLEAWPFAAGFAGIALFWAATAGMTALGRLERLPVAVAGGALVGVVTGRATAGWEAGGWLAIGAGVAAAAAIVVADTIRLLGSLEPRRQPLLGVPSHADLAREAAPYFGIGACVMAIMISPHLLVLLDRRGALTDPRVVQFELAVNLALIPLVASSVYADRLLHRFWDGIGDIEGGVPAADPITCSARVSDLASSALRQMTSFLLVSTGGFLLVTETAILLLGDRTPSAGIVDPPSFEATVVAAAAAYGALAWGLLVCGMVISLGAPRRALATAALGAFAMLGSGAAFAVSGPIEMKVMATAVGAMTFALSSRSVQRALMGEVVHRHVIRM